MSNSAGISAFDLEKIRPSTKTFNAQEQQAVLEALATLNNDTPPSVLLSELTVVATPRSELDIAHQKERGALVDLLAMPDFTSILRLLCVPDDALIYCDRFRNLYAKSRDLRQNLAPLVDCNSVLSKHLDALALATLRCGNFIYASSCISVEQWHNFYSVPLPASLKRIAGALIPQQFTRDKDLSLGNYRELLDSVQPSPLTLTPAQRARFSAPATLRESVLARLADPHRPLDVIRFNPRSELSRLFNTANGKGYALETLRRVGWYGATAGETPAEEDLHALLVARILLEAHPSMGSDEAYQCLFGFHLYGPQNVDLNRHQVLAAFEAQLIAVGVAQLLTAPMLGHLLLAGVAPEFAVRDVPDSLLLGSTGWLSLTHAATYIENVLPGACCAMTYAQVMAFADQQLGEGLDNDLYKTMAVRPMLNWAALNNLIQYSLEGDYSKQDLNEACAQHDRYLDSLNTCANSLTTALPTREAVARTLLEKVLPHQQGELERKTVRRYNRSAVPNANRDIPFVYSVLDLYMSGELLNTHATQLNFDFRHDNSITWLSSPERYFKQLTRSPIPDFENAFSKYFTDLQSALITNMKLTLSLLPLEDRLALEYGDLMLYRVRKEVDGRLPYETEAQRQLSRGRFGVIVRAYFREKLHYYELLTFRAECHKRPDLHRLIDIPFQLQTRDLEYHPDLQAGWLFLRSAEEHWPLDYPAYATGSAPDQSRSSTVVVDKIWQSFPDRPDSPALFSPVEAFYAKRIGTLVDQIFTLCPPVIRQELHEAAMGVTVLEAHRQQRLDNIHQVLNLLIPFKGCIEDATSGDPERESAAVVSCVLDGISVLGAVLGTAPQLLSVALRAGSATSKVFSLARVGGALLVSLVNPLDGVPSLLQAGSKLTRKGTLLLSRTGQRTTRQASATLRQVNLAGQSMDVGKVLAHPDVRQAKWLTYDNFTRLFDLMVIRRGIDWYLLDVTTMSPRGPKLVLSQLEILPALTPPR